MPTKAWISSILFCRPAVIYRKSWSRVFWHFPHAMHPLLLEKTTVLNPCAVPQNKSARRTRCAWETLSPNKKVWEKGIYIARVTVKVMSLGGVSMPNVKSISYSSNNIAKVKQTDRTNTICPQSFHPGHKKGQWSLRVISLTWELFNTCAVQCLFTA